MVGEQTPYHLVDAPELLGLFVSPCAGQRTEYVAAFASNNFRFAENSADQRLESICWTDLNDLPKNASQICNRVAPLLVD